MKNALKTGLQWLTMQVQQYGFRDYGGTFKLCYREVQLDGKVYFLPNFAMYRPAVKRMRRGQIHEPRTHALIGAIFTACDGSMVHGGAFFGEMIPSFSDAVDGTVWCFEPVNESYVLANKCLSRNECANVILFNAALSDKTEMRRINTGNATGFARFDHRGGMASIDEVGTPVPAMMLDQFAFDRLQVIHLDIEGHELPALVGARETIRKHAPLILIEDSKSECAAYLTEMGYRLHGVTPELWLWVSDLRPDHRRILDEWLTFKKRPRKPSKR